MAATDLTYQTVSPIIVQSTVVVSAPVSVGSMPAPTIEGWRAAFDPLFDKPLAAAQQQWASYEPQGKVVNGPVPDGWRAAFDPEFAKPFPSLEQQWAPWSPQILVNPLNPIAWQKDSPAVVHYSLTRGGSATAEVPITVYVDGWRGLQLDIELARPFVASQQQWASFEPRGAIIAPTLEGWRLPLDVGLTRPLAASLQQWTGFVPEPFPLFFGGTSFDAIVQGMILVEDESIPPLNTFTTVTTAVWQKDSPVIVHYTVGTGGLISVGPSAANVIPNGWFGHYDLRTNKGFPNHQQQWASFGPEGTIVSAVFEGWRAEFDPIFDKPLASTQQQWAPFQPLGTVLALSPDGWRAQFDPAFGRPVAAAQQQWAPWPAEQITATLNPIAWQKDSPAVVHYSLNTIGGSVSIGPLTVTVFTEGWRGHFDPETNKGFPQYLQQWDAWPPQVVVVVPPVPVIPPSGGGHRKPKSPRPIWDIVRERERLAAEEAAKAAAEPAPTVEAKAPDRWVVTPPAADWTIRQLDPSLIPTVKLELPKPVVSRSRARIVEEGDSAQARAAVAALATVEVHEADDSVAAHVGAHALAQAASLDQDEVTLRTSADESELSTANATTHGFNRAFGASRDEPDAVTASAAGDDDALLALLLDE